MSIMDILGKLCDCLSPYVSIWWEQHTNLEENFEKLKRSIVNLNAREKDRKSEVILGVIPGVTEQKHEVRIWFEGVEKINLDFDCIKKKFETVKFYSRAGLGKEVAGMIKNAEILYQQGAFPNCDLVLKLPQRGSELPTTTIHEGETTWHKKMMEILACLLDEKVCKIGVFGMGGIGKTTALEHINNKIVLNDLNPKFDQVIFVTVSKAPDIKSLQDRIARELNLVLAKDDDEGTRAKELCKNLRNKKRFVLILDDMWNSYFLTDVGIPEPTSENGCKLVVTTRSRNVCSRMSCEPIIEMELLSEEEALNLFRKSVGDKVSSNLRLAKMVEEVAQECARLPLAIVIIAGFLRDKDDPNYWVTTLEALKHAATSTPIGIRKGLLDKEDKDCILYWSSYILNILRLSYDRLKDKRHQECLLYCALYPEDYPIERDLLIDQLIAEGIVDDMMNPTEMGQVMLTDLARVSLLIDTTYRDYNKFVYPKYVKLHDLTRDMALQIMSENPTRFLAKAGEGVESIPVWNEGFKRVSLMRNKIIEISSSIEPPNCPMLSTLFLNNNPELKSIPRNFFQQMLGLNVLNLSSTNIVELPGSVSLLLNLAVLLLSDCRYLAHVPNLSKLSNMRRLDLHGTKIYEVPKGMEKLVKLASLDLSGTNLAITEELGNHRNLKSLRCKFAEFERFNAYVRSLEEGSLTDFYLTTKGERRIDHNSNDIGRIFFVLSLISDYHYGNLINTNVVTLNSCDTTLSADSADFPLSLPKNLKFLEMINCLIKVPSLCKLTSIDNLNNLQRLHIQGGDLMYLFYYSQHIFPILQRIERLELEQLPCLREFVRIQGEGVQPSLTAGSFSSLNSLYIRSCGNIKKLFTSKKNASFPNLVAIRIYRCKELEEIVSIEEGGLVDVPKLKELRLWSLPKLQIIPFSADSLNVLSIERCPSLKQIPFLDKEPWHPSFMIMNIDEETWTSLEWNYPKKKDAYRRELESKWLRRRQN